MPLPTQIEKTLSAALAAERARVEADEKAANDASGWWNDLVGGGSASGAIASALAGRKLYALHVERAGKARASGDAQAAAAIVRDIDRMIGIPSMVQEVSAALTFAGGAKEIGKGIASDAADLAVDVGRGWMLALKATPAIAVLALALIIWRKTK